MVDDMLDSGLWVAGLGAVLLGAALAGALSWRVGVPAAAAYLIVGVPKARRHDRAVVRSDVRRDVRVVGRRVTFSARC